MNFRSKLLRISANKTMGEFRGLPLVIENPKGSIRDGVNTKGERWESVVSADYGYIKGVDGRDGEGLDVYVGEDDDSDKVYVVEQLTEEGDTDEFKLLLGFPDLGTAYETYLENYPENWGEERVGRVFAVPFEYAFEEIEERRNGAKTASPDFGYSKYNDRENDLQKVRFRIEDSDEVTILADFPERGIVGSITLNPLSAVEWQVENVGIAKEWQGTGLGQLLYDKAVEYLLGQGANYLFSGYAMSPEAKKAWNRLEKRYPVHESELEDADFVIDLTAALPNKIRRPQP